MENEEVIVKAMSALNEILQNKKALRVSIETDDEWEGDMKSLEISVKYIPMNED